MCPGWTLLSTGSILTACVSFCVPPGFKKRARWLQARRIFSHSCPNLRIPNRFLREGNLLHVYSFTVVYPVSFNIFQMLKCAHTLVSTSPCPLVSYVNPPTGHCIPPARSGHRCVADSTNLYVFGGYNPDFDEAGGSENEDYPLFRELWRFHFATASWQLVHTEGYMPTELASMSGKNHKTSCRDKQKCNIYNVQVIADVNQLQIIC